MELALSGADWASASWGNTNLNGGLWLALQSGQFFEIASKMKLDEY